MRKRGVLLLVALALTALAAVRPGGAAQADPYAGYVNERAYVRSPYGAIYVEYWRPVKGRVPVLLSMSPYRYLYGRAVPPGFDGSATTDVYANRYLPKGYARAYADLLGTGQSDGCWDYGGAQEAAAGAAVVEWLGTRPWSTGKVGMIGTSYDGAIQLETATLAPKHLAAIVPQEPVSSWYHYNYEAAVSHNSTDDDVGPEDTGYPIGTPDLFDFVLSRTPATDLGRVPSGNIRNIQDRARICDAIDHNYRGHVLEPSYGAFWRERDWSLRASRVRAAVLLQHGWRDSNTKPDQFWRFWNAIPDSIHKRALLGRWNHTDVFDSPPSYATPPVNTAKYLDAFLAVYLKGASRRALNAFPRILTQGSDDKWRTSLPKAPRAVWRFAEEGTFVNSGTETSKLFKNLAGGTALPGFALWETPGFGKAGRIVGPSAVNVSVTVTGVRGQLDATLLDIDPSGNASIITLGLLDLRYASDPGSAHDLESEMPVSIRLRPVDYVVAAGHRLQLVLAGSEAVWGIPDPEVGQLYTVSHVSLAVPLIAPGPTYRS
ncbi:MAG: CocE/NonD family hydrolase [Actinomycetota bacterium]